MQTLTSLKEMKPSYIREILQVVSDSDVISFAGGLPSVDSFPMNMIESGLKAIARDKSLFQYGTTHGYEPLIDVLNSQYDIDGTQEILITSGAQQAIDLCARAFIEKRSNIVVESPCYLGALQAFNLAGANILSVYQEIDGPNVEQLELLFKQNNITLFYAVPDFHNPTGCCWSLSKRRKVASLCIKYDVLFVEDAPYRALRFVGEELPTVTSFCKDHAIMLYSFSKFIAPALRVGAMVFPQRYLADIHKLKQAMDLHTSVPMQELVTYVLKHDGFQKKLTKTKNLYYERYSVLKNELENMALADCEFREVEGGMFIWLRVEGLNVVDFAQKALSYGVAVVPGDEFYTHRCQYKKSAIRLNFTHNNTQGLIEGMKRIRLAMIDMQS